jgi:hypothetical protein
LGADLQVVCREFDIVVQRSVPYRHHHLGRMKRQWRALFDTTLAMLDDSMLDTSSWEKHFSRKCISETECGDREANVFHIRQDLDNFLIYLTFEFVLCQVFYPIDTRK